MGTRNLTVVKSNDEIRIAQYGQWDGYPEGQGSTIVEFLLGDGNLESLKENLSKIRFLDEEGQDKEFIESYNEKAPTWSSDPDNRTDAEKEWWSSFMTRDLGAEILTNVANSDRDEILLNNSFDFGNDSLFCEYAYVLDLDEDLLYVYEGFQTAPHDKGIWADGDLYEAADGTEYYPVTPIAKMSISKDTLQTSWIKFLKSYEEREEE